MAGMLPGVEAARRRRFHNQIVHHQIVSSPKDKFIRPNNSFSLYATKHDSQSQISFIPPTLWSPSAVSLEDNKLDEVAREAKRRLDLRLQRKVHWGASKIKS